MERNLLPKGDTRKGKARYAFGEPVSVTYIPGASLVEMIECRVERTSQALKSPDRKIK